ncbi:hypothetical protein D9613_002720 [Agrocybe pediades]|uniref:F-box domain-containing protein n=1 Tax=Agrocybe pediades TaxID=84607 RepID=A0A8H4QQB1_9AGAR|nr:hypothetical protein D9613_002720 [Agrocybe pediades]
MPGVDEGDLNMALSLPFATLEEVDYRTIMTGPRISSVHTNPKSYYGPVTIKNYIAGWTKKALRTQNLTKYQHKEMPGVFLSLPVELQLLVLEHLHPIDLYHLSLTSKYFRSIVMDPKATGVWTTAFQKHPDLPECPRRIAKSHWAFLLYGPGICSICNKYGALSDLAFYKQYCELCMRRNYSYANALKDMHGNQIDIASPLLTLIPKSHRYHGIRHTTSYISRSHARYLRVDFDAMLKKLTLIQVLIEHGVYAEELTRMLKEYKDERFRDANEAHVLATKANTWATEVYKQFSLQYDSMLGNATAKCIRRLLNAGFEKQDLDYVQFSLAHSLRVAGIYKLTNKAYRQIRTKLEEIVTRRKVSRLTAERRSLLEGIFRDYKKAKEPETWQYLPPSCLASNLEGFSTFLNADFTDRGNVSMECAVSLFPEFVAEWTRDRKLKILRLFAPEPQDDFDNLFKRLELATSVVTCRECKLRRTEGLAMFGWKQICLHMRTIAPGHENPCINYEIMDSSKLAVSSLIRCVGLDPTTTTAEEMNDRDDRFLCGDCMAFNSNGGSGLKAYTWTECAAHTVEVHPENTTPVWHLLTPEASRFVKEHESAYPRPRAQVWRCNKCAEHYSSSVQQNEAIAHVRQVHLIDSPIVGVDVVADMRHKIGRRKPFRLRIEPGFEYRCKRCMDLPIYKLWELQSLMLHLRLKHHIPGPMEGDDWEKIPMIVTPTILAE